MKKLLCTIAKTILFFIGWALLVSFIPIPNTESPVIWRFWAELIPFLCVVGISVLFWLIHKRKISVFPASQPAKSCIIGIISGIV